MKIAILGAGNIGGTLGKRWASKGHTIIYGVRDPQASKVTTLLSETAGEARAASSADAVQQGEVVLFSIPGGSMDEMVAALGSLLPGKIVIDATNKVGQGPMDSLDVLRRHAPEARLFRAFNTLGWENFAEPELDGQVIDLFYCGESDSAQAIVDQLISDIGLRPVYIGETEKSAVLDGLTRLWFTLVFDQRRAGGTRRVALKMLGG